MCTRPAHRADLDHTVDWARHGLTVAWNLGSPCRHCHRLKHQGGWTLTQPEAGRFVWLTLLGASYSLAPRPVVEALPAPLGPRADGTPRPVLDAEPLPATDDTGWIGPGWIGPGWIGPGWIGPGWIGPGWIGPGWIGPGWIGPGRPDTDDQAPGDGRPGGRPRYTRPAAEPTRRPVTTASSFPDDPPF